VTLVTSAPIEDALRAEGYAIEQVIPVEPERFARLVYVTRAPAVHVYRLEPGAALSP
jgi:hypothetical protein